MYERSGDMKLRYTEQDIRYLASSPTTVTRGYDIYADHLLDPIQFIEKDHYFFTYEIKSGVMGTFDYYEMMVLINNQGLITRTHCECKAFQKYSGCCKHLVALLMAAKELDEEMEIEWEKEADLKVWQQTQDVLYHFRQQTEQMLQTKKQVGDVLLLPKLKLNQGRLELEVSIGKKRLYVIKDLKLFANLLKESLPYTYGVELNFTHTKDAFAQESKPFLNFLLNAISDVSQQHKGSGELFSIKSIPLTHHQFELLFQLYENKEIAVQIGLLKNKLLHLTTEDLPLQFNLERHDDQVVLTQSLTPVYLYETEINTYVFTQQAIYKVSDELNESTMPLLKTLYHKQPELKLGKDDMNAFISYVVPQIKSHMNKATVKALYDDYQVYPLQVVIYMDINEHQALTATVYCTYGDTQFILTDEEIQVDVIRDRMKEALLLTQLAEYGFVFFENEWMISDENQLYDFMKTGLPQMTQDYEVHGSEVFSTLKVKQPKRLSVGVRLDHNLMAFSFDELPFNLSEYQKILEKYKLRKKYHRLKDGAFLDLESDYMTSLFDLVQALDLDEDDLAQDEVEMSRYRAIYLDKILEAHGVKTKKNQAYKEFISEFKQFDEQDYEIPSTLQANLRPYQETGFRWLRMLSDYGIGGVLADDMGLGKTIQIITLLASDALRDIEKKPSIIVAPSSLLYNWLVEFERFAPHLNVQVVSGTAEERARIIKMSTPDMILITSYDMMRRDVKLYKMAFRYVIIDEAHYIKNQQTQNAKAVKKLKSEVRFALTGTPLENSIADLWSIFDFILPGYLLTYAQFKQTYEVQIVKHQNEALLQRVRQLVAPFIMRRLKKEVLTELPDKIETVMYCELENEQRQLYDATLLKMNHEIQADIDAQGLNQSRIKMLAMLTRLRQLCCHPTLYIENYEHDSAKLSLCLELIRDCLESGHRILLFSQFTSMLDILKEQLQLQDIPYYLLTGQTSSKERLKLTQAFNEGDVPIFLISLKAGGTGLNLTGADVVIHYDPWWNMSAENQATDRAHRMGQTNKVQVFKLITKGTIEEKIEKLQQRKLELSQSLVQEGEQFINHLSTSDIKDLFSR